MSVRGHLKRLVEALTDTHIYRAVPRGTDLFLDIRRSLPKLNVDTVFDVGANTGQSAGEILQALPEARIFCFEPVKDTFETLSRNTRPHSKIQCFNVALGNKEGSVRMAVSESSDRAKVISGSDAPASAPVAGFQSATMLTLDEFCRKSNISHIGLLKVDTEGGDLDVIQGGQGLLHEQKIDLVLVEAGMNSKNQLHVPLEQFRRYLEDRGYFLFGLYEQVNEWPTGEPHLRRVNPLFVSEKVIQANRSRA